jgi:hypothetical protein
MIGGFPGAGWEIIPIPNLFADPSRPSAIMVEDCEFGGLLSFENGW